ncbi:hypothetical protein C8K30_10180 [Promicromonospora sp. AC04]|uniref:hypothetical protein n=1 Tax=Promicromonospora sp. AC04 TaxID=2135723 RepID=UPI000D35024E|nr:hypothetical protein [Promicromonospora sp. AC04]PUB31565.1 hypothetical protein C8K30_10180 [Promicromonospora sp. AC04]
MSDSPRPENDGFNSSTPPGDDLPDFDFDSLEIPDDLSSLTGDGQPEFAALITQIAGAEPLAAASSLAQLDLDAVPTPVGAVGVLKDLAGDAPDQAAAAISQLVRGVPLVLITRTGEQMTAVRFTDGVRGDELAPGLVLGGAPESVVDLLTGATTVADAVGVVGSTSISKFKAVRMLTSAARKARKGLGKGEPGQDSKDGA